MSHFEDGRRKTLVQQFQRRDSRDHYTEVRQLLIEMKLPFILPLFCAVFWVTGKVKQFECCAAGCFFESSPRVRFLKDPEPRVLETSVLIRSGLFQSTVIKVSTKLNFLLRLAILLNESESTIRKMPAEKKLSCVKWHRLTTRRYRIYLPGGVFFV